MFRKMTKKELRESDKRLAAGIKEFAQICDFRDSMTKIFGPNK
jgi:hypothetical protein